MGFGVPYYIDCLKSELESRKTNNPRYSLRSFSRSLKIDSSQLSRILNRKETPVLTLALSLSQKLSLNDSSKEKFLKSVAEEKMCRSLKSIDPNLTDCKKGETP